MLRDVVLDFRQVKTDRDLHLELKSKFCFPAHYGMNWDAFWDSLTVDVEVPASITILGKDALKQSFPRSYNMLRELLRKYVALYKLKDLRIMWR